MGKSTISDVKTTNSNPQFLRAMLQWQTVKLPEGIYDYCKWRDADWMEIWCMADDDRTASFRLSATNPGTWWIRVALLPAAWFFVHPKMDAELVSNIWLLFFELLSMDHTNLIISPWLSYIHLSQSFSGQNWMFQSLLAELPYASFTVCYWTWPWK